MGVAAGRLSATATPRPARRVRRTRRRAPGGASRRSAPRARTRTGRPSEHRAPEARTTFWDRLDDDRALVGLKIVLLVSLFVLTALLEWARA